MERRFDVMDAMVWPNQNGMGALRELILGRSRELRKGRIG